jgi:hypothetical protein
LPHQRVKNYCAWSASKNRDTIKTRGKTHRKIKVNKEIYAANLPFETGKPELETLFLQCWRCHVCQHCKGQANWPTEGVCIRGDVYPMGSRRAVSMLNRRSFMGKDLLVKEARESRGFRGR